MATRGMLFVVAAGLLLAAGCSTVQKGTAAGGAIGATTGAAYAHLATGSSATAGGLVGLGLGAATGAIAADYYYSDEDAGELENLSSSVNELSKELTARENALKQKDALLAKEKAQQKALLEAYEKLRSQKPKLAANVSENVKVTATPEGITYTILSEVLFDSGQATLTEAGKGTLHQAAQAISRNYPDADVQVRGHTDNVPIKYSPFDSNWDLSCARALAVLEHLIESEGFAPKRLMAAGCGQMRPVASNSSPEGRRQNRRAELVVRPAHIKVAEVRASD
ncbi:MAG: flagellar motor protein MotB [Candidatus Brocadiia bacterium]